MRTQDFVSFYSPGTLFAEVTQQPIDSWDVKEAIMRSREIVERHGARPYAFRFTTRGRSDIDLDSREIDSSGYYYLDGKVSTLAEVEARNLPGEEILRANMRGNGYKAVVESNSSGTYRWTQPFGEKDCVVDTETGEIVVRGVVTQ